MGKKAKRIKHRMWALGQGVREALHGSDTEDVQQMARRCYADLQQALKDLGGQKFRAAVAEARGVQLREQNDRRAEQCDELGASIEQLNEKLTEQQKHLAAAEMAAKEGQDALVEAAAQQIDMMRAERCSIDRQLHECRLEIASLTGCMAGERLQHDQQLRDLDAKWARETAEAQRPEESRS